MTVLETIRESGPKRCAWCDALIEEKNGRLVVTGGDDPKCLCKVKENK